VSAHIEAGDAPLVADLDVGQIQQVLTNLMVNGIQAMPHGGELRVVLRRVRATPPVAHGGASGEWLCVEVRDQGTGIAPENLSRLFEPFFTTKDVGEGTGLGLAVAYGIVRDHDGWIDVSSELGHGSRFSVYLPATPREAVSQRLGASPRRRPAGGGREVSP
jgi:signal transduction histidine kinase